MRRPTLAVLVVAASAATAAFQPQAPSAPSGAVETLDATDALPTPLWARLEDPIGFAQATTGEYVVLDRRAHTVYAIDATQTSIRTVLQIGFETGRIIQPGVLALSKDDIFAVADAPNGLERIQYFNLSGLFLGGFYLQSRVAPRLAVGPLVLNGVGSMHFTGRTFLVNRPDTGALFSEYDVSGRVVRQIGTLRPTGQESDPDVHLALNIGMPLADPTGGYIFVFQTGVPLFRKYDANGTLLFERHIEGVELDAQIQNLPTEWPRRPEGAAYRLPVVDPLVRTAAVDPAGRLWVSLMTPFTYVYGTTGEKIRTIQFRAGRIVSPASLVFARGNRLLVTPGCLQFKTDR